MIEESELSMAQKLEMVRTATSKGLGVGSLGPIRISGERPSLPDMPQAEPLAMDISYADKVSAEDEDIQFPSDSGGGSSVDIPLTCSYDSEAGTMSVRGAYWQNGSLGAWVALPDVADMPGTQVYLVIEQDPAQNATIVAIQVRADTPDPRLELDASPPYRVTKAHVLIAEFLDGSLRQYETGNMTLGLHQLDGSVTRWPHFLGGSPPPIPEP